MASSSPNDRYFCLRRNRDGSVDSFCVKCFATVSRGESDAVRMQLELSHACNPYDVERFERSKTAGEPVKMRLPAKPPSVSLDALSAPHGSNPSLQDPFSDFQAGLHVHGIAIRLRVPAGSDFQALKSVGVSSVVGLGFDRGLRPVDVVTARCQLGEGGELCTAYHVAATRSQGQSKQGRYR